MTKGDKKRQKIFEKYRDNLNLLIENSLIEETKELFICPICLEKHADITSDNPLTLEDAPPKSLGGKANTLTCKKCNNTCGHQIDFHLTERLRELDNAKFPNNSETKVRIKIGNETFNGKIKVENDGTMKMFHSKKNNHPEKLEEEMVELKAGTIVDLNFLKSRVIPEKLEYAILKSAYLLAFEKFGYSLILDKNFNIIREQLLNPEERLYPSGFWFTPPYPKELCGVYFICDKGLECLLAMFMLETEHSSRMFGAFLPLPINPIEEVVGKLNDKLNEEKEFKLSLYPMEQDEIDYIEDLENIKAMFRWLEQRAK
ncbi:HNH endonuclease [Zobellia uliginosa]|uniref:HNH endonuclease n=1 Tax=Zobellia uliginosa TaxID=143224 RepID=UPI001C0679C6|nr:HNH endonuclease [Zobellia uliginosa]MBU2947201.1 HNH endonuclease [Zobellia uliginosa]